MLECMLAVAAGNDDEGVNPPGVETCLEWTQVRKTQGETTRVSSVVVGVS